MTGRMVVLVSMAGAARPLLGEVRAVSVPAVLRAAHPLPVRFTHASP